ncbi:MAG: electron transfer flavoprotein subunit alpha/FixB family protein [Anaerolineaceae bacterium]|nr:electron transfer flavoprotein subunit alpha/FixB family protein [Anaerolineaceae bacterium]
MPPSRYRENEESKAVWVYLEQEEGTLENVSLEVLSKGRELADVMKWKLVGLSPGSGVHALAKEAITRGADEIWVMDHPLLTTFTIEGHGAVVYDAVMLGKPSIFLLGATHNGRDLAGRLAVRFRTGLNADCTNLHMDEKDALLVSEVSGFGGGVVAMIEMQNHRPQMATVRPGVFALSEPDSARRGKVIDVPVNLKPEQIKTRILERVRSGVVDLTRVPVLVVGGRGVNGDFETLKKLAEILGGDVGATRPPVDAGFIERERQIGQTGVVSSPKMALCCGLSGAFHLLVGIDKADVVVSINSDPEAPIFEFSDYYIVGDVSQYLPVLIQTLESQQEISHA